MKIALLLKSSLARENGFLIEQNMTKPHPFMNAAFVTKTMGLRIPNTVLTAEQKWKAKNDSNLTDKKKALLQSGSASLFFVHGIGSLSLA